MYLHSEIDALACTCTALASSSCSAVEKSNGEEDVPSSDFRASSRMPRVGEIALFMRISMMPSRLCHWHVQKVCQPRRLAGNKTDVCPLVRAKRFWCAWATRSDMEGLVRTEAFAPSLELSIAASCAMRSSEGGENPAGVRRFSSSTGVSIGGCNH